MQIGAKDKSASRRADGLCAALKSCTIHSRDWSHGGSGVCVDDTVTLAAASCLKSPTRRCKFTQVCGYLGHGEAVSRLAVLRSVNTLYFSRK